jgi:hypothetical protein
MDDKSEGGRLFIGSTFYLRTAEAQRAQREGVIPILWGDACNNF